MGFIVFVSSRRDTASQYGEGRNISVTRLRYSANHNAPGSWPIRACLASQNDELCKNHVFQKDRATIMYSTWKIMCFYNNVTLCVCVWDSVCVCVCVFYLNLQIHCIAPNTQTYVHFSNIMWLLSKVHYFCYHCIKGIFSHHIPVWMSSKWRQNLYLFSWLSL